jgi:hypothetical protein
MNTKEKQALKKKISSRHLDFDRATQYHVIYSSRGWRFIKANAKRSYIKSKDKSEVMIEALYKINQEGGRLIVHNKDGSVDWISENWM